MTFTPSNTTVRLIVKGLFLKVNSEKQGDKLRNHCPKKQRMTGFLTMRLRVVARALQPSNNATDFYGLISPNTAINRTHP